MTNHKKPYKNGNSNPNSSLSTLVLGKVPPQAIDIEQAVLGAILNEKNRLDDVVSILKSENCFYVEAHQKIYRAILNLSKAGSDIDQLTVVQELRKMGELEIVGGAYKVSEIAHAVITGAHVETHARIVMEKYLSRELILSAGKAINAAYDEAHDVFDLIDETSQDLYELTNQSVRKEVASVSNVVMEVMMEMEELYQSKETLPGISTGNTEFDALTGGLQGGTMIVIAARPAQGKTAFALCLLKNIATNGIPAAFFSLEMKNSMLIKRLLASTATVEFSKVLRPNTQSEPERERIAHAGNKLGPLPIHMDDTSGLSITEFRAKVRRLVTKKGVRVVFVDYLQLMTGDATNSQHREQEVAKISRQLKTLALDLDITIVALSQLSRSVETRAKREYKLSDLRESGSLEQDADMVAFLHVPTSEDFKDDNNKPMHVAGLFVEKHRNGALGKIPYMFRKEYQEWTEFGTNTLTFISGNQQAPPKTDDAPF